MKLPKYETFSIIGIINILIGIYLCQWLLAKGINDFVCALILFAYYMVIIYLYRSLRIELEISIKKKENEKNE